MPYPHTDDLGFWYHVPILHLTIEAKLFAARRIATEAEAEAARITAEAEAARIAEAKAVRIAEEAKAAKIAAMIARCNTRTAAMIAAEAEATRRSTAESASVHRPVKQSPECKRAERERYEFWTHKIEKYSIPYLQGKMADESPPPQALPSHVAELLGRKTRFYAGHYPPTAQGTKGCTDPRTGGPTCKTNKIIYDVIYASLPDDCKLTFVQMFCNLDDLCPLKAPLYINGKQFDFEKHFLNLLTTAERAEWWRLTVNHLKWKYIDAINSGVQEAIVLVFGRLPQKYWPAQHQEALEMACNHILHTKGRVVEFKLQIITCDRFSSLCYGINDERIIKMQEALKKSQGGILKGRVAHHLMQNFNLKTLASQVCDSVSSMLHFLSGLAKEECEDTKLVSLSDVPASVLSYYEMELFHRQICK